MKIFALFFFAFYTSWAASAEVIVGYVKKASGIGRIQHSEKASRSLLEKSIIYEKDTIVSLNNFSGTIIFRDNSRLKIFANSEIEITSFREVGPERKFNYRFFIKRGGAIIFFSQKVQNTTVETDNIKVLGEGNSIVHLVKNENGTTVSHAGKDVIVKNIFYTYSLTAKNFLSEVSSIGVIEKKLVKKTARISLTSDQKELRLNDSRRKNLFLTFQLRDPTTNFLLPVPLKTEIYSDSGAENIPSIIQINKRGYAYSDILFSKNDIATLKNEHFLSIFVVADTEYPHQYIAGKINIKLLK